MPRLLAQDDDGASSSSIVVLVVVVPGAAVCILLLTLDRDLLRNFDGFDRGGRASHIGRVRRRFVGTDRNVSFHFSVGDSSIRRAMPIFLYSADYIDA